MKGQIIFSIITGLIFCTGFLLPSLAQEMKPIQLPEPKLDQSKSLAQVMKLRPDQRITFAQTVGLPKPGK